MKNGRINHLGNIGAIMRGTRIILIAGGKANLVIDNNMYRSLGGITPRLRHLQGFHNHTLTRKCRITMYLHGYNFNTFGIAASELS